MVKTVLSSVSEPCIIIKTKLYIKIFHNIVVGVMSTYYLEYMFNLVDF